MIRSRKNRKIAILLCIGNAIKSFLWQLYEVTLGVIVDKFFDRFCPKQ